MSFILHPVNASLFIKPEITMPTSPTPLMFRVHSLDNLMDKSSLTEKWVCSVLPATRRIKEISNLGTTFPPIGVTTQLTGMLGSGRIERQNKSNSEPDLTPFLYHSDDEDDEENEDSFELGDVDDDHLFEFDMSPSGEIDDGENVIEEQDDEITKIGSDPPQERRRAYSVTSDSSGGSCSHRKLVEPEENYRSGFCMFGSTSSGLGSDRRALSQDTLEDMDGGISINPGEWRDYINERLSNEGTCTPTSPDSTHRLSEGSATPILAVSPVIDSPLISPDSLLDGQHPLADMDMFIPCLECRAEADAEAAAEAEAVAEVETDSQEDSPSQVCDNKTISVSDTQDIEENVLILPGRKRLSIGETELHSLLSSLEKDRGYPGVKEIDSLDTTTDIVGDISPLKPSSLEDESFEDQPKLRKCSSLRTGRTPPGTPGKRKIVRFADIFGLDLQEVKTFTDEIPKIPRKAFQDLDVDINDYDIGSPRSNAPIYKYKPLSLQGVGSNSSSSTTALVPMFTQPGSSTSFYDLVRERKVCLENAFMEDPTTICGVVRVVNISFHKSVGIRWTMNDWSTQNDVDATYIDGSSDGVTDKFSFRLRLGFLPVGSRVQFCLRFDSSGSEFWDSNGGVNYVFQVFLNSNSPGGVGGVTYRTSPLNMSRNTSNSSVSSYHSPQSPSQHGDDPWLRFM